MTREDKIKHIANHYGFKKQCRQCIEEMAELTQAISKYERAETETELAEKKTELELLLHVAEEVADVEIMINQLRLFLGASVVEVEIERKLDRQLKRIADEKKRKGKYEKK